MTRKPRSVKNILSKRRTTHRSQPIADDGKSTFLAESLGERNVIHCLRFHPDVHNIQTQALSFTVFYNGRECTYTPDISGECHPSDPNVSPFKFIIEEKSDHWFKQTKDGDARINACREAVEELGYRFHLVFRNQIERARNNVQRMMVARMNLAEPEPAQTLAVIKHLPATFKTLTDKFGADVILALLGYRYIYLANLHQRLTGQSPIVSTPYCYEILFP